MAPLTLVQWNCRSLTRNMDSARLLLQDCNADIAAFCETYLDPSVIASFANHEIISRDRNRQGGGVAIAVAKHIKFCIIENRDLEDLCTDNGVESVLLHLQMSRSKSLYILSLYSPSRNSTNYTSPSFWQNFFRICSGYEPIVVCGDFNGKSPLWCNSPSLSNVEGKGIEAVILNSSLTVLNDGSFTWCSADLARRFSLDLTIVSRFLAPRSSWRVLDFQYGSDHFPVITTFSDEFSGSIACRPYFSVGRVDWKLFTSNCSPLVRLLPCPWMGRLYEFGSGFGVLKPSWFS